MATKTTAAKDPVATPPSAPASPDAPPASAAATPDAPPAPPAPDAPSSDPAPAAEARVSTCVVNEGKGMHVGNAVNGKVCSYHAMHYDSNGKKRR